MVKNCCVKNCSNSWFPNTNLTYHNLGKKRLEQWSQIVPSKNGLTASSTICSAHFDASDFVTSGVRRTLKSTAVPHHFGDDAKKRRLSNVLRTDGNQVLELHNTELTSPILEATPVHSNVSHIIDADCPRTPLEDITTSSMSSSTNQLPNSSSMTNDSSAKKSCSESTPNLHMTNKPWDTERIIKFHKEKQEALRRKIKILQSKLRRREKKLTNLTSIIKVLKKQGIMLDISKFEISCPEGSIDSDDLSSTSE
ncbi:uncharacterized protein LOC135160621 [Diachasmimorpha longicaudata]|uniref:uncharacterized protein LOC135160621 n=1 Tax=Diachasmimorpha longicaudata TaxID=58733 RepID=UPI0030B90538